MAEEEGTKKDDGTGQTSDEGTQNTDTGKGGDDQDDPTKKKLEESASPELAEHIKDLRAEQKKRRLKNDKLQGELDTLKAERDTTAKRLKELEDKGKSDGEKEAERVAGLETAAGQVAELEKYHKHVKTLYGERMKVVKEMDEKIQESIDSLLEDMPKDDFLGRLKIINAVLAVSGNKKTDMSEDDVGNPAKTGDGESSRTLAKDLAWSPMGQQEAELAGLMKTSE